MYSTVQKECRQHLSADQMAVFDRLSNLSVELVAKLAEKKQLARARNMTDNELAKLSKDQVSRQRICRP